MFCFVLSCLLFFSSQAFAEILLHASLSKRLHQLPPFGDQFYQTNLDLDAQKKLKALFESQGSSSGGVVLIHPLTGKIWAAETYHHLKSLKQEDWLTKPLLPAASLMKIVTLAAALSDLNLSIEDSIPYRKTCSQLTPSAWFPHAKRDRARLQLRSAFAKSCNAIFGRLAVEVGFERMAFYLKKFGFFRPLGGDLVSFPTHLLWPEPQNLLSGDLAALGSGLGFAKISLLHAALLSAPLVNGGNWVTPRLSTDLVQKKPLQLSDEVLSQMRESFRETLLTGTARRVFQNSSLKKKIEKGSIGLKTGTLCQFRTRRHVTLTTGYVLESSYGPYVFSTAVVSGRKERGNAIRLARKVLETFS